VVPHLITQDKIIYLGHASSSTSIRCF
jgi:hypothetical protein